MVTLHSPEKPDATEVQPAPQPFRAAAGEAQLDVHPETDTAADPLLDHMAAWNTVPAAPEIEAATVPYQPEEPEQPEQLGLMYRRGKNRCGMWAKFSAPIFWQSGETSCA